MFADKKIWMAKNEEKQYILPRMANRHGMIAGATGTGKTVTMKVMAETFSDMGVPVFMADVKGDLTGTAVPGKDSEDMQKRIERFGLAEYGFEYKGYPVAFWDVYGEKGTPVRTTISEMGPLLLSRIMGLNNVQTGILEIVFKVADDAQWLLLDLKDLKAILNYVTENASELRGEYGNVTATSVGAIMRGILQLEQQGGEMFFGEPALDLRDWVRTDLNGRGIINILSSDKLIENPLLYSTFLLWMLSELYEMMPEVGDLEKPRMVFFFDEAHLLFDNASKVLLQKIEQVVRLIRSKGVGVYFVSQKPTDIPNDILAQLGNKVQHGLRAFSPAEQRVVKSVADSFVQNPAFDTREAILALSTGEALVSFLDESGKPMPVERTFILPPQSLMGAATPEEVERTWKVSEMNLKYEKMYDRESAYEILSDLAKKAEEAAIAAAEAKAAEKEALLKAKEEEKLAKEKARQEEKEAKAKEAEQKKKEKAVESTLVRIAKAALPRTSYSRKKSAADRVKDTAINAIGGTVVSGLIRGIFGTLKK